MTINLQCVPELKSDAVFFTLNKSLHSHRFLHYENIYVLKTFFTQEYSI